MQIDLPQDLIDRVQQRTATGYGANEVEVIRKALDSLDRLDQERAAIQEGIDAWHAGNVQDWDAFDRQFRSSNGISADC